jgi:hypothetical protein
MSKNAKVFGLISKITFFLVKHIKKTKSIIKKRPMIWQKLAGKGSRYVQKNQVEVLDKI